MITKLILDKMMNLVKIINGPRIILMSTIVLVNISYIIQGVPIHMGIKLYDFKIVFVPCGIIKRILKLKQLSSETVVLKNS